MPLLTLLSGSPAGVVIPPAPAGGGTAHLRMSLKDPVWLVMARRDPVVLTEPEPPVLPPHVFNSLLSGLTAYWRLDETSGDRADWVGICDLTTSGGVTGAAGKQGDAASFSAAGSGKLTTPDHVAVQTGDIDFTLAGWFRATTLAGSAALWAKDNGIQRDYRLDIAAAATGPRFILFDASGGIVGLVQTGEPLAVGTWYFVCCWHDATTNTINIQVNGGVVHSAATTGTPGVSIADFRIGDFGNTGTVYWDGAIDEVGLWKRVLTADERTALYAAGSGIAYPFGTVWPQRVFFGAAGNISVDLTTWYTKTVPPGVTWRILGLNVLAERFGTIPAGGELHAQLQVDLEADGSYITVAESGLETGDRVAYQGQGPLALTLTAGQRVRAQTIRTATDTAYFSIVSAIVEVIPA